ncbi:MAG TPA: T9SS type A sorting domain-containing protein, partial [Petrimonas mucosa]|nr:T9SS type A sorting domain-containing protein [Petrimonas mucosa]
PIIGYHTAIPNSIPSGTYYVRVENGNRKHVKKIVIK